MVAWAVLETVLVKYGVFMIHWSPTAEMSKVFGYKISHSSAAFLEKGSDPAPVSVLCRVLLGPFGLCTCVQVWRQAGAYPMYMDMKALGQINAKIFTINIPLKQAYKTRATDCKQPERNELHGLTEGDRTLSFLSQHKRVEVRCIYKYLQRLSGVVMPSC
ncbi:uncharacterized protein LOC142820909 isoform X3 [Pelodiscus sinensis]|uniref:uncharacterized protein LOC142820909 isoform X3 n=1 Tax=Pelodiscus sinensis TaxID=13735 RepID=UPI003F6D9A19